MERCIKLKDILYSQFLEEEGTAHQGGGHMGSMPENRLNQASWDLGESEDPWADAIIGLGWSTQGKGVKGFYWFIWISLGYNQ